ncbi:protein arginine N-methyltransferase 5-like [Paramacrobiotus metropolitanus]|uniref:protein arginine N-methyltransferase 5-like n=1 Tax=Paramacrobiotus metropolitanus TaxID=2943436 RepID=UPI0024458B65|nr:protein arginine N-methyltransferase 5-like [Paramacrobiotus metropolitanus]
MTEHNIPFQFGIWVEGNGTVVKQHNIPNGSGLSSLQVIPVDQPLVPPPGQLAAQCVAHVSLPTWETGCTSLEKEKEWCNNALAILNQDVKAIIISPEVSLPFKHHQLAFALSRLLEKNWPMQPRDPQNTKSKVKLESVLLDSHHGRTPIDPFNPRSNRQIWIRVPLFHQQCKTIDEVYDEAWQWWTNLRKAAGVNPKLALMLDFGPELPQSHNKISRWFGERLRAAVLPDEWSNGILSKSMQILLQHLYRVPQNGLFFRSRSDNPDFAAQLRHAGQIFAEFRKNIIDPKHYDEMASVPDNPIFALQPLQDHISEGVYAIFESLEQKYVDYHMAIYAYLKGQLERGTLHEPFVAMVVGAGRGPLAWEFIQVADMLKIKWKLYCIDKNPIAIEVMKKRLEAQWKPYKEHITIVFIDMRQFHTDDKADLIISELIGSMACNECSPECIDGAQRLLKPEGVSIPWAYDSYVQPVMSIPYWEDIHTLTSSGYRVENEMAIVSPRNFTAIARYQKAWRFQHPNYEPHTNERNVTLKFVAEDDYILTGFTGYFDMLLYGNASFNILPDRQTVGIGSDPNWFPAYFCLSKEVAVKKGQEIIFSLARRCDPEKSRVWYEWALLAPELLPLQNFRPDYWLGLKPDNNKS